LAVVTKKYIPGDMPRGHGHMGPQTWQLLQRNVSQGTYLQIQVMDIWDPKPFSCYKEMYPRGHAHGSWTYGTLNLPVVTKKCIPGDMPTGHGHMGPQTCQLLQRNVSQTGVFGVSYFHASGQRLRMKLHIFTLNTV